MGYTVAGVAEDLDVSGSVDALDRTGSGPWLRDRLSSFDVIVSAKLDRVGRSARHISSLVNYLLDQGKNLQCVKDQIDISTPMGRMFVYFIATMAEMELDAISQRNEGAAQYNIRAGKYRGGPIPAGYRKQRHEDKGWILVPDENGSADTVREIVRRALKGDRLTAIVADLNADGVQTPKDRQAELAGREQSGRSWSVSNLRRMLCSPTLIGQVVHRPLVLDANGRATKDTSGRKMYGNPEILFGEDGSPVANEPVISEADFYTLQRMLDDRREAEPKQRRAVETTLLVQVLFCGTCGKPMYRLKGGPGRKARYRCHSVQTGTPCGNATIPEAEADETVTGTLLAFMGDVPFAVREYRPGTDNTDAIAQIDGRLSSLAEAVTRFPAGSPALTGLLAEVDTLSAKRDELAAMPTTEGDYSYVTTGETFRERWEDMTSAQKNDYLRDNSIRATYCKVDGRQSFDIEYGETLHMLRAVNPKRYGG